MHDVLLEESAQATVEYAIVTVALLSIVLAIAGLWRAGTDGHLAALVERAASDGDASTSVIGVVLISRARTGRRLRSRLLFCCRRF